MSDVSAEKKPVVQPGEPVDGRECVPYMSKRVGDKMVKHHLIRGKWVPETESVAPHEAPEQGAIPEEEGWEYGTVSAAFSSSSGFAFIVAGGRRVFAGQVLFYNLPGFKARARVFLKVDEDSDPRGPRATEIKLVEEKFQKG